MASSNVIDVGRWSPRDGTAGFSSPSVLGLHRQAGPLNVGVQRPEATHRRVQTSELVVELGRKQNAKHCARLLGGPRVRAAGDSGQRRNLVIEPEFDN